MLRALVLPRVLLFVAKLDFENINEILSGKTKRTNSKNFLNLTKIKMIIIFSRISQAKQKRVRFSATSNAGAAL